MRPSGTEGSPMRQKADLAHLVLRLRSMATSVTALSFMLTATKENSSDEFWQRKRGYVQCERAVRGERVFFFKNIKYDGNRKL
jgi:hypothetical protein